MIEKTAKVIDLKELMGQTIGEEVEKEEIINGLPEKKEAGFFGLDTPTTKEAEEEKAIRLAKEAKEAEEAEEEEETDEEKAIRLAKEAEENQETEEEKATRLAKEAEATQETEEEKEARLTKERAEKATNTELEAGTYAESIKNLFGGSVTHILQENEEGEEVEIAIEEVEITQEVYESIVSAKMEELKEEAKAGTVSTEGISDFTKQLIEVDRLGGDVRTLLKNKETYIDVLDKIDLNSTEGQKKAIYMRYKATSNHSEDEINILIKGYEDLDQLSEKAETADKEIRDAVQRQIDLAKSDGEKAATKNEALLKEYKTELRTNLDSFDLDKKIKDKVARLAVKKDEKGQYEIDKLYYSLKNDPKKAAELALFLLDKDEYNKQVSSKVKKEVQLSGARKALKIVKKPGSISDLKTSKKGGDKGSVLLTDLNN